MYDMTLPDPYLRYDRATNRFVLIKDYVTPEYTVPAGEFTDGATIPRLVELGMDRFDRHLPACIVHDYMYRHAIGTKAEADKLFECNLIRCGTPSEKAYLMYRAVKLGGKGTY